jgi:hypothetical protein
MHLNSKQVHKMRRKLLFCAIPAKVRIQLPAASEILQRQYELPVDMHIAQLRVIPFIEYIISAFSSYLLHCMSSVLLIVHIVIILYAMH